MYYINHLDLCFILYRDEKETRGCRSQEACTKAHFESNTPERDFCTSFLPTPPSFG